MKSFVSIDDRRTYRGYRTIVLENEHLRLEVLPELGAKLFRFVRRASNTDLLWHHPRVEPRAVPIGASYDDNFAGGWDELFPNDAPGRVGDEVYPDHGELWCQPWDYRVERDDHVGVELYLSRSGSVTASRVEKWISLAPGEQHVRFRHRIKNTGTTRLEFLWKLHPALAIDAGDRLDIPGAFGELVDPQFGRISAPGRFGWPVATPATGEPIDFSVIPASDSRDFLYVRNLYSGWCALRRLRLGIGFGLAFPKEVFTSVWLFLTYGGWRGLRTVVLEPCTAYPKNLVEAIAGGECSRLEPGASLECEVCAVTFEGAEPVREIRLDGTVVR